MCAADTSVIVGLYIEMSSLDVCTFLRCLLSGYGTDMFVMEKCEQSMCYACCGSGRQLSGIVVYGGGFLSLMIEVLVVVTFPMNALSRLGCYARC